MIDYTTQTRELIRETREELKQLKNMIATRDEEMLQLKQQLALVQAKLYRGGTV